MGIFLLISIIALLVLLFATYKKPRYNKNKSILSPTLKLNTTASNNYSNVTYEGTGNLTQRLYRINVHFYPDQERCEVIFEGEAYHFKRYSIGSEYEYKNERGILRVRGNSATLVFPSGRIFQVKAITELDPPQ